MGKKKGGGGVRGGRRGKEKEKKRWKTAKEKGDCCQGDNLV